MMTPYHIRVNVNKKRMSRAMEDLRLKAVKGQKRPNYGKPHLQATSLKLQ